MFHTFKIFKMAYSPSFLDNLFCQEEDFLNEISISISTPKLSQNDTFTSTQNPLFIEQDLSWDDNELKLLFSKQTENPFFQELEKNFSLEKTRKECVEWILNVVAYYSFSNVTAVLAVNCFDRFFCNAVLEKEKPWMAQLVAVACLSLAAKVEETKVPLLLDLQVEESSRYVFEPKTIQRMELLVLSTLDWKMNPVTPISFIDHFTRRLGFDDNLCCEFLTRCEGLIVSLISDSRFMRFLPSVLATATMLHVINTIDPCLETDYQNQLLTTLKIDKEQLDDCFKLISDSTAASFHKPNKRKYRPTVPGSPNGVIDVCFSSECSNDSWVMAPPSATTSVTSSPEPLSKKFKADMPSFWL